MKKILFSLSIALMACVTSFSQEVIEVVLPEAFIPGEEATVTVTYTSNQEGFFRALFSRSMDEAGTTFDFGAPLTAANSFGSVGAIEISGLGTLTTDLTFTVPLSASVSADVAPLKAMIQIDMNENGTNVEFGTPFRGIINVEASDVNGSISEITLPTMGETGGIVDIPLTYTHNFEDAQLINCYIIQADADGNADFDGTGVQFFATIATIAQGTDVAGTYQFSIPSSVTPSADLPDGRSWLINVQAFEADTRGPITITAGSVSTISNIAATPEVGGVPTQEIGGDLSVTFNYEHSATEGLNAEVALVIAEIGGDFVDFPGTGWKTAGFTTLPGILPADGTSESFNIALAPAEVDITTEDLLAENQEWRLYIRLIDPNTLVNGAPAVIVEDRSTVVTVNPFDGIPETVNAVSTGFSSVLQGDSTTIVYSYSSPEIVNVEIAVQLFEDEFTGVTAPGSDSVITYVSVFEVELPATGSTPEEVTKKIRILATDGSDLPASSTLPDGQNYRIVTKLLNSTTGAFILQDGTPLALTVVSDAADVVGLVNKTSKASFTLFPNPSNGVVNFSEEVSNVVVYDATGNIVITEATATTLNTASLEAGIYMVNTNQGSTKFIVE